MAALLRLATWPLKGRVGASSSRCERCARVLLPPCSSRRSGASLCRWGRAGFAFAPGLESSSAIRTCFGRVLLPEPFAMLGNVEIGTCPHVPGLKDGCLISICQ
eukprot:447580-Prymnesium_polylepis.1